MLRQRFGYMDDIEDCTTLRGMVMYAAWSRFVDNGTTVLTGRELRDMLELLDRMEGDEELAGNISSVGMGDISRGCGHELGDTITAAISDALDDLGLSVSVMPVYMGTDVESPGFARMHVPLYRKAILTEMALSIDVPNDLYEQRLACRSLLCGDPGDAENYRRLQTLLGLPYYYDSLPQEMRDTVDMEGASRGAHAYYLWYLSSRHRFMRAMRMVRRNPGIADVEIEYEEAHD